MVLDYTKFLTKTHPLHWIWRGRKACLHKVANIWKWPWLHHRYISVSKTFSSTCPLYIGVLSIYMLDTNHIRLSHLLLFSLMRTRLVTSNNTMTSLNPLINFQFLSKKTVTQFEGEPLIGLLVCFDKWIDIYSDLFRNKNIFVQINTLLHSAIYNKISI